MVGHTNAIIGPNGAGKSTLLKTILGEIAPDEGTVNIHGISRAEIAYLPQIHELDNSIPFTVYDLICLGLLYKIGINDGVGYSNQQKIDEALQMVGLFGYQQRYIHELSRGELQRVLMAKIIVQNAKVIILDEPFNAMDSRTIAEILNLIQLWRKQNKTVIAVLHDIQQVITNFEYSLLLAHQMIAFGKTNDVINKHNLEKAYQNNFSAQTNELCDSGLI
jgi:zinc/manganese transport system ATP-binding protein